jgi:predicted amino acid-binding ACT domain protein
LIADRRGIVASITGVLAELSIGLLELTQTVVCGYFTITLAVAMPNGDAEEKTREKAKSLEATLPETIRQRLGGDAAVTLVPFQNSSTATPKCDRYILTATGHAHTETIHAITELVAERGGNFVDFAFENSPSGVSFMAEIDLPAEAALGALQIDLAAAAGRENNLRVRLQHQRLFTATNDIAFRRVGA